MPALPAGPRASPGALSAGTSASGCPFGRRKHEMIVPTGPRLKSAQSRVRFQHSRLRAAFARDPSRCFPSFRLRIEPSRALVFLRRELASECSLSETP
eukprot:6210226-Pleurochrysis_carterae.AAC.1